MRKRFKVACLALISAMLVSCADTAELYDGNAFAGPTYIKNRYSHWDDGLVEPTVFTKVTHGQTGYFNGSGDYSAPEKCFGLAEGKRFHPEYFRDGGNELFWTLEGDTAFGSDIANGFVAQWADNSSLIGRVYGQTKKMTRLNSAFSRGYLSKLYNGQIKCDAWSYYSMVLLDKTGYGTIFPSEMQNASYFAFSARGSSDSNDSGIGRVIDMDVRVTFYKYAADGYTVVGKGFELENVLLQANKSSEFTSLVGFSFSDVGYDPAGTIGMSMTYTLNNDPLNGSDDFGDGAEIHTGLSLLEVMFPDSSWN